jgi:DNA polymerase-3 subunit beta
VKFHCERDSFAEALSTAARASSGATGSLPVLAGLRLSLTGNELSVTGTDMDLTIELSITVRGEVDGTAVIPGKLASDVVRAMAPGAIAFHAAPDEVTISGGRSEFSLRPFAADDFPKTAQPASSAITIPAAEFADALRQVVRAASGDKDRPIITGVLLTAEADGLRLVATDSYRLAVRDLPGTAVLGADQKVLVPSRALSELQRVLAHGSELTLRLGEREATFEIGGTRLTTRLIEGEYPNYRNLIPSAYPNKVTISREALLDALRRVKILATREATPVRLSVSTDGVQLTTVTADIGTAQESLDATLDGSELTVAFNPEYLAAGAEAVDGEEATLELLDGLKPAVIRGVGHPDYLYLLMPVRVP